VGNLVAAWAAVEAAAAMVVAPLWVSLAVAAAILIVVEQAQLALGPHYCFGVYTPIHQWESRATRPVLLGTCCP